MNEIYESSIWDVKGDKTKYNWSIIFLKSLSLTVLIILVCYLETSYELKTIDVYVERIWIYKTY